MLTGGCDLRPGTVRLVRDLVEFTFHWSRHWLAFFSMACRRIRLRPSRVWPDRRGRSWEWRTSGCVGFAGNLSKGRVGIRCCADDDKSCTNVQSRYEHHLVSHLSISLVGRQNENSFSHLPLCVIQKIRKEVRRFIDGINMCRCVNNLDASDSSDASIRLALPAAKVERKAFHFVSPVSPIQYETQC